MKFKNYIIIKCISVFFLLQILTFCTNNNEQPDYNQFVNPFIGTEGVGHTFPGATYPLGLVQLSPDTGNGSWDYCSGYQYNDTTLFGFSYTHLSGGGNADLGDIQMLPFSDKKTIEGKSVTFSKAREHATPGYYTTFLTDDQIQVELTASERTGMHRYIFNNEGERNVLINIEKILRSYGSPSRGQTNEAELVVENNYRISGSYKTNVRTYREIYFAIHFDQAFNETIYLTDTVKNKLVLNFARNKTDTIIARVAISTVSIESAWKNMEAESSGKSFDEIRALAANKWNEYLSLIEIKGENKEERELFYTSLYHLFIQPNNIADVEGNYRGADGEIHASPDGIHYSTLALWDTYRAAHPLYTLITPDKNVKFVNSLIRHYEEVGYLPVWAFWGRDARAMIGNHAVPVIVDACLKGLPGIDHEKAYEAVKASLTTNHWKKYNWTLYDQYGFLPSDLVEREAVSMTLEAGFDDWCAAQLAKHLNKQEDYIFFEKRSKNYQNLYDPLTGFMRGKNSDSTWVEPFNPLNISHAGSSRRDYTEANAWQYLWSVQHDIKGLIKLMGGEENFTAKLDSLFFILDPVIIGDGLTLDVTGLIGQYAHGNEPSQHVIYLYNFVNQPQKIQELIRRVLKEMYKNTPDGLCGNDDYGQMSAWYILSSLGFYPVNPASGVFDIGRPAFEYVKIRLGEKSFEIKTTNFSNENIYVKAVYLNGQPVTDYKLSYNDIVKGGELVFEMTSNPN